MKHRKRAFKIQMKAAEVQVLIPKSARFVKLSTNPQKISRKTAIGLTVEIAKAATGGFTQSVLIYFIPTTTIMRKNWILGHLNIFSVRDTCQNQKK